MGRKHLVAALLLAAGLYACSKEDAVSIFTGFKTPANFPQPVYRFADNPVTKEGFALGKKLFYDPILSRNNTISCGSCHIQTAGFTHHGHSVSHGIDDQLGTRNSPAIMNLAWSPAFMWDGGIFDLDLQPVAPVTNHVEMDETVENVLAKLRSSSIYPALFKKAFGSQEISSVRFLKALSQFMLMCVSSDSKYDSVQRSQAIFTAEEQNGYALFRQQCSGCHREPLFTDFSFRNNGLSISSVNDMGRYAITLNDTDRYRFKVPSLRNLDYTPPYMHDGRLLTLDAVLDHYTNGVEHTPNLDASLQNGIALSAQEKQDIKAFLKTLNDKSFVTNPLLSE
ncbi:MAG: cytochrome c peroxidase [Ferruginibacter sp.]